MVRVQVRKRILQPLLLQQLLLVARSHQKLREINQTRPICVNQAYYLVDLDLGEGSSAVVLEHKEEFLLPDDSVAVLVDFAEALEKSFLVFVGVELGGDVGVDDSLEFVLKLDR